MSLMKLNWFFTMLTGLFALMGYFIIDNFIIQIILIHNFVIFAFFHIIILIYLEFSNLKRDTNRKDRVE